MRLLERNSTGEICLTDDFHDDKVPRYAILSHTWGTEEVTFEALTAGAGKGKLGYDKIRFCNDQARRDGLHFFWVDTCCIDKSNNTELQEAINSMFRWYRNATKCYVYLADVSVFDADDKFSQLPWESALRKSRWFTRGWTLQELIAPAHVEFFSQEGVLLGDKKSLEQHIHDITGIRLKALRGSPLSDFSVAERMAWIEKRETTRKEDKAYSLLGIFDIQMPLIYGEGEKNAFRRLQEEINKASSDDRCLADLRTTDPRDDKTRIEQTKGGLLEDSYRWILGHTHYQRLRHDEETRLLWITGDPGKGKTMLLCGLIDELSSSAKLINRRETTLLSFFFCQSTDSRINNATAVLRGLIYLLVRQQPSLIRHVRESYDHSGKQLFEDVNAWSALSRIFANILQDSVLESVYLIIDALDECDKGLSSLIDFIVQNSSLPHVKWIISSRNRPDIEKKLKVDQSRSRLNLELKQNAEYVSQAIDIYIKHKVSALPSIQDDETLQAQVCDAMRQKAEGTFLWVSLVIEELKDAMNWQMLQIIDDVPTDLKDVYLRMIKQIQQQRRGNQELCWRSLSTVTIAYRPLSLEELGILSGLPLQISNKLQSVAEIVSLCGSFLTIRDGDVYIIHQSAKDFLSNEAFNDFFHIDIEKVHYTMFSQSLYVMSQTLQRDIYMLGHPGFPVDQVIPPEPDPLAAVRYSCVYWIEHLRNWDGATYVDLQKVSEFLRRSYLHWLEALSLLRSVSDGILSIAKLEYIFQGTRDTSNLIGPVRDAHRFILRHKSVIESTPLQVYASALIFSPARSITRNIFKQEEPEWIVTAPAVDEDWDACLQTLELGGYRGLPTNSVRSVVFSHDSRLVAALSEYKIVQIWEAATGRYLKKLGGQYLIQSVAFSDYSIPIASILNDHGINIVEATTDTWIQTFRGHHRKITTITSSRNSKVMASASNDGIINIWEATTGTCTKTFQSSSSHLLALSHDSALIAMGSGNYTITIRESATGNRIRILQGHNDSLTSIVFSHNSIFIASGSYDHTVKIWEVATGKCIQTLQDHRDWVNCIAFSHDSRLLASGSNDSTIKVWEAATGTCVQTLTGHGSFVYALAFSHDSRLIASGSYDGCVKIWEVPAALCLQTLQGHHDWVISIAASHDAKLVASGSRDKTIKIWEAMTSTCVQTLVGHGSYVHALAFSHDSRLVASGALDIKIWVAATGVCLRTIERGRGRGGVASVAFSQDSRLVASTSAPWDLRKTVDIWDTATAMCLHTLAFDISLEYSKMIRFAPPSIHLCTTTHRIDLDIPSASVLRRIDLTQEAHQGYDVTNDGMWITWRSEKLLWLPSDFRPSVMVTGYMLSEMSKPLDRAVAVVGSTLIIGCHTGRVLIIRLNPDGPPQPSSNRKRPAGD